MPTAEKPTARRFYLMSHGPSAQLAHADAWANYKAYLAATSLLVPLPPSPPSSPDAWRSIYHRPPTPFASSSSSSDADSELDKSIHNHDPPTSEQDIPAPTSQISSCSCASHLRTLERDLEATKQAVAARDEELVALRRAVTELRLVAMRR